MPDSRKNIKKGDTGSRTVKTKSQPPTDGARTTPGTSSTRLSRSNLKTVGSSEKGERKERAPREPRGGGGGKVKVKLSLKFAVCIIVIVVSLLLLMGIIISSNTRSSVEDQIERRGYVALKMAIASGEEYVLQYALGIHEYNSTIRPLSQEARQLKEEIEKGGASEERREYYKQLGDRQNEVQKKWDENKGSIVGRFNRRFEQAIQDDKGKEHGGLLNVIVSIDRYGAIQAKEALTLEGDSYEYSADPTVTLKKGFITQKDGKSVSAWSFIKKFKTVDPRGGQELEATAIAVLSAERIQEIKSQINSSIIYIIFFGLILGVVAALFLANLITKPISQLVSDIEIVARGSLDHRTLARSNDEIGLLAHTFDVMTRNLNLAHKAEVENRAREHELGIAQEIQANLLPKKIPQIPGYDLGCFYLPSKEVGGDYYDYIQIDEQHLGLIVADVSGKGIPGSMVMTMARSLIRYEAQNNLDPVDTFIKVNRILAQDIRRGMFVTAMYLIMNTHTGRIKVASAGHNPMAIFRDRTKKVEEINPNGIALGFDKGPIFERTIKMEEIKLEKGDRLALYTDGVVEAMSPENEEFGEEKFYQLCELHSHLTSSQYINLIVKALEKHKGEAPQSDDITISTVKMLK